MKNSAFIVSLCIICSFAIAAGFWFVDDTIAPLFLNSRIERLGERGLPAVSVEKGGIIYCRMKADDFRLPLPPKSHPVVPITATGGFDSVDGNVKVLFDGPQKMTEGEYLSWLSPRLQIGADVQVEPDSDGLRIKFHYFGDK